MNTGSCAQLLRGRLHRGARQRLSLAGVRGIAAVCLIRCSFCMPSNTDIYLAVWEILNDDQAMPGPMPILSDLNWLVQAQGDEPADEV